MRKGIKLTVGLALVAVAVVAGSNIAKSVNGEKQVQSNVMAENIKSSQKENGTSNVVLESNFTKNDGTDAKMEHQMLY